MDNLNNTLSKEVQNQSSSLAFEDTKGMTW